MDGRLHLEKLEQIFEEQCLLGNIVETAQDLLDVSARAGKGAGEHGKAADGDTASERLHQHDRVSAIVAAGRNQVEQLTYAGAPDGQRAVFAIDFLGETLVAAGEVIAQAEHFDFFGALRAGSEDAQIIEQAALRGPAVEDGIRQCREVCFPQKRRNYSGDQQGHQPGRENDEQTGKGEQTDGVLAQAEQGGKEPQPSGGLAARALQLVVKDRVLEGGQIQAAGVPHQADADPICEAVAQQALAKSVGAGQKIASDG